MAITPDGWFDWMRREPGPPDKVYSQPNAVDFYVAHSAVGHYGGWASRLFLHGARHVGSLHRLCRSLGARLGAIRRRLHSALSLDGVLLDQWQPGSQHAWCRVRDRRWRTGARVGAANRGADAGARAHSRRHCCLEGRHQRLLVASSRRARPQGHTVRASRVPPQQLVPRDAPGRAGRETAGGRSHSTRCCTTVRRPC